MVSLSFCLTQTGTYVFSSTATNYCCVCAYQREPAERQGTVQEEYRLYWAHDIARIPPQINHSQALLYNSGYADQYQVSWKNKRDEKINNPKHA